MPVNYELFWNIAFKRYVSTKTISYDDREVNINNLYLK